MSKRYSGAEATKAIELGTAALTLSNLRNDLLLLIKNERPIDDIAVAADRCNDLALQLNAKKDQLRLV
ncbi:hypothetical protein EV672_103155 [Aquabacterium commune]|uniref:Uncharacterized protein n=2 Tax=Aquabacterium commune TaxID=70586 RepID=A0A4R6RFZ9_9BURK|nr:hypothetical protein EV672_103155 [Aquabacterium commune]